MTDKICGTAIVFPALNIKRALPLKETLMLRARLAKTGYIAFACGMNI
jgi:plastocyanin domain-containing protein